VSKAGVGGVVLALALGLVGAVGTASTAQAAVPGAKAVAVSAAAKAKKPGKPGTPKAGSAVLSRSVKLSWSAAKANGAAIDKYQVKDSKGRSTTCKAKTCKVTGLTNGVALKFRVRAHNKKGWGGWSKWSKAITPDTAPGAPAAVKVSDPQDGSVLVSWGAFANKGSAVRKIHITWQGAKLELAGTNAAGSRRVAGLDNNTVYTFSVAGENGYDIGQAGSAKGQSSGKPLGLKVATPVAASNVIGVKTPVTISWTLGSPNGPKPVTYKVSRSDGKAVCTGGSATTCVDDSVTLDGTTYTYTVTATNATGGSAHSASAQVTWTAAGSVPGDGRAVVISRGAAHQDAGCTSSYCSWVLISTSNLSGAISCTIYDNVQGAWGSATFTAPLSNKQYWYYGFPGRSVWVVCGGVASNHVTWPGAAPTPSVTVTKGAAHTAAGCTTSGCAWVQITTSNLSGSMTCTIHDNVSGQWDSQSFTAPLDHKQWWYYGYNGRQLWVVCGGIESNHLTW
jgi:hypothetical protein